MTGSETLYVQATRDHYSVGEYDTLVAAGELLADQLRFRGYAQARVTPGNLTAYYLTVGLISPTLARFHVPQGGCFAVSLLNQNLALLVGDPGPYSAAYLSGMVRATPLTRADWHVLGILLTAMDESLAAGLPALTVPMEPWIRDWLVQWEDSRRQAAMVRGR